MTSRADHLFGLLEMLASIGMTWWVSATVLCAGIVGAVWVRRQELRKMRRSVRHGFFVLVFLFLVSVIVFGVVLITFTQGLGANLEDACKIVEKGGGCSPADATLIRSSMKWGYGIGTTSFIGALIAWVILWVDLTRARRPRVR
jgi:hypothetical protein